MGFGKSTIKKFHLASKIKVVSEHFLMGIDKLGEVIKKECPQAIKNVENDFEMFRGKTLCFDTSGLMYKMVATCKSVENDDHLKGFVNVYRRLVKVGAQPLFVFDGKQTFAKLSENQKRAKIKAKTRQKLEAEIQATQQTIEDLAQDTDQQGADLMRLAQLTSTRGELFKKQDRAARVVKPEYYGKLRELFRQEGVPFVTAEYEAEKACCWLVMHGYGDIVVSDDYDCLVCGVPFFLQHFNSSTNQPRFIHLQPVLDHLKMTHVEFVDYCILLGCDFGGHIKNIGPARALTIIHKHKNIDAFLASPDGKSHRQEEPFNYDVPRSMFLDDSFPLQSGGSTFHLSEGWRKLSGAIQSSSRDHILIPGKISEIPNPLGKREMEEDEWRAAESSEDQATVASGARRKRVVML